MLELLLLSIKKEPWLDTLFLAAVFTLSLCTALHAVVYKREPRAAIGWFALIVSAPIIGSLLYSFLGVNRIANKAKKLQMDDIHSHQTDHNTHWTNPRLHSIQKTGESLSYSPPCPIEQITPLNTGDEAYPAMLEAIHQAQKSIDLFSYIFEVDPVGIEFLNRLEQAIKRGVQVRLLVDAVGSKSTLSKLEDLCKKKNIPLAVFLRVLWRPRLANLRNHRKLLIVDNSISFTGGLNIAEIYWPTRSRRQKVLDFHFTIQGPISHYLKRVFIDDWEFSTGELVKPDVFPQTTPDFSSKCLGRVVVDGPGDDFEKMRWHFLSAIHSARKNIRITTPYFLPDTGISTALISASLRGVSVDVIIPGEGDHAVVTWATHGSLWDLLRHDVRIWHSPPPFDHSKMFIVDDDYLSMGSSNWDPRSLRLNFELNVEVYSPKLAQQLIPIFENKKNQAIQYRLIDHENRPYWIKVRDGFSRMLSPYL